MLQATFRLRLDWKLEITAEMFVKWISWLNLLKTINKIRRPRYYHTATRVSEKQDAGRNHRHVGDNAARRSGASRYI